MPSLFRFLAVIAIICGTVYGGLFLLAHLLEPVPKETSIPVPGIKPRR